MNNSRNFEFEDLQGLLRFGHGKLVDSCFLLLNIADPEAAKNWLREAPVTSAETIQPPPDTALQIAFSASGLTALGVAESVVEGFSDEFISGMSGNENRSRRLGDIGANAPGRWAWGGDAMRVPHVLLMLYARKNQLGSWRQTVQGGNFSAAFELVMELPESTFSLTEPFGFADGISQPKIDWENLQSTDTHDRDRYSNFLAAGDVVLGYPNEYGLYTARPLIEPQTDPNAGGLPDAIDDASRKDFARNGSYLVVRQLGQDVPGFWRFVDQAADSIPEKREQLAAAMVGRNRDGSALVSLDSVPIPGVTNKENNFTYDRDADGLQCPIGAHIRRSNPRTGDLPPRAVGLMMRLRYILGFAQEAEEDLVASTRFHRLLRRGRAYGPELVPEDALKPNAPEAQRGLHFLCLVGNISRQFEFVQNAWSVSSKFSGLQSESDPLLGHREPLLSGDRTDLFHRNNENGPKQVIGPLPQFVTVRGGGYFFLPGLRAIGYLSGLPSNGG